MQRHTIAAAAMIIAAAGATAALAAPASAAVTPAAAASAQFPCGYDAYHNSPNGAAMYNHCGKGDIVLKVDHFFWQTTYDCFPPGVHAIDQGDSNFAIIGAEYTGFSCTFPGPLTNP